MVPFDDATQARATLGLQPYATMDQIHDKFDLLMMRYDPNKYILTNAEKVRSDEIIAAFDYLTQHEFVIGSKKARRIDDMLDASLPGGKPVQSTPTPRTTDENYDWDKAFADITGLKKD